MTFFQYYYSAVLYPFWLGLSWGQIKYSRVFGAHVLPKTVGGANSKISVRWQSGAAACLALLKCLGVLNELGCS